LITNNQQTVDIWKSLEKSISKFSSLYQLAFLAINCFNHSLRKTSKVLGQSTKETSRRLAIMKRKIRKDLKNQGANLNLISNILEDDLVIEITEELDDDIDY
tara:strand:- start:73 stop:378 length:306 start_codon:yes stop_codon:yes gene_type:complete